MIKVLEIVFLYLFFICNLNVFAGSLKRNNHSPKDVEYFNSMIDMTSKSENLTARQRQFYAKNGLNQALKMKSDSLLAISQQNMGYAFRLIDQVDSALYYYHLALGNFKSINDSSGMSTCYTNIGCINTEQYNYNDAILALDAAMKIERSKKDSLGMLSTKFNLLTIYIHKGLFEKAWYLLNELEVLVDKYYNDDNSILDFAILKAEYYLQFLQVNSNYRVKTINYLLENKNPGFNEIINSYNFNDAEDAVKKVSSLVDKSNDSLYFSKKYLLKGHYESLKNNVFLAQKYYYKALNYSYKYNHHINLLETYISLGLVFALDDNKQKSVQYFNKVDSLATQSGNLTFINQSNIALQLLYQSLGEYKKSMYTFKKLLQYQDTSNHVIAINALYRNLVEESVHEKERMIDQLQHDKDLLYVRITYGSIIFLLSVILMIVFFILFRKKRNLVTALTDRNVELAVMTEQYLQANSVKDTMFSIVAHDLKNPVASFVSMLDLIVGYYEDITDEEKLQYLQEIKETANQLFSLLQNLLTWSRTQRDQIECNPDLLDLTLIVDNTIDSLIPQAKSKKINLINKIEYSIVYVDCNLTMAIIRNIVSNAIKFSEEGKNIEIGTTDIDENYLEIYIKDEGVGIPPGKLENMFAYDSNNSTLGTSGEQGTGLGLMLCKEFAVLQKGDIRVASKVGFGSTFFVKVLKNSDKKS